MGKVTPFSKKLLLLEKMLNLNQCLQGFLPGLRHIKLANQKLSRRWKTVLNIGKKDMVVPVLINLPG